MKYLLILGTYTVVFWVVLPFALWQAARFIDGRFEALRFGGWFIGWLLASAGAGFLFVSIAQLWKRGGGPPVSSLPPPRLTTTGAYGVVRHPIYFGFNLALLGIGLGIGSFGLAAVVSPIFFLAWIGYATLEERALVRRFGPSYQHYIRTVGLLPRLPFYPLGRLAMKMGVFRTVVQGESQLPRQGGVLLVANHACYLDPVFVGWATDRAGRRARFVATADVFRHRLSRWLLESIFQPIPIRRYRSDTRALRNVIRYLEAGEVVCIFPEGERTPLGALQPPLEGTARFVAKLPYPVLPVGISGSYDVGPRWADVLRRAPVTIRIGAPINVRTGDATGSIYRSIRELLVSDPQPVHKAHVDPATLSRVIWRCPRCLESDGWQPAALMCGRCSAMWEWLPTGDFRGVDGTILTLAELARPVWRCPEPRGLRAIASGWTERSTDGPIRPLEPLGEAELCLDSDGLRFQHLFVTLASIRSVTVERADTLQIATTSQMWQFRVSARGSAFRMQLALTEWRGNTDAVRTEPARVL